MAKEFAYKAKDPSGKTISGKTTADDMSLVAAGLKDKGLIPISITPVSGISKELTLPGFLGGKVDLKELAIVSRQFATMVDSGLTLVRALGVLAEQTEDRILATTLAQVRGDVEQGASLSAALAKHPKVFSDLYVAMIRAGEAGGNLDQVLTRLSTTLEKQVELRRTVKSAMTYPVVVVCVVFIIVTAMLVFIVPTFSKLFAQLHARLPAPTQFVVDVSHIVASVYAIVLVAAVVVVVVLFRQWIKTDVGRLTFDTAKLKIPILGKVVHKASLARFTNTLASLVSSGVPIVDALDIVADTSGNRVIELALRDAREGIRNGRPLAMMLAEHPVMPGMVTQMIDTGEQTGSLDVLLQKIADFYDAEVKATVDALTSILEPILIVIIGAVVGGIVICLYLPMFDYIKAVQNLGNSG
jgi:type IV pilus assembly protein PilC